MDLMQRREIDARPIKTNTPSEDGNDERRPDDSPAVAVGVGHFGRRHSTTSSRRLAKPRRLYKAMAATLSGRT